MTVILVGIRAGTREPLVLVRCESCHDLFWIPTESAVFYTACSCGHDGDVEMPLTLAEADVAYPEVQKEHAA